MGVVKVVSNSSPLINLIKVDRLDLLEKLYGQILIPGAVHEELVIKGDFPLDLAKINFLIDRSIIKVQTVQDSNLVKALYKDLDRGESEVIALALE